MLRRRRSRIRIRRRHSLGAAGLGAALAIAVLLFAFGRSGGGSAPAGSSTATAALVGAASPVAAAPSSAPTAATSQIVIPAIHPDRSRLERAQVVRVIDGDTIVVDVAGSEEHVRYYGINTTERGQACYQEAKDRNQQLIGAAVLLLPDARDRDRYGRLLRYVFDASGASVDAELIGEGLAYAWREDGTYRDELVAEEQAAQAAKAGCLWSTAGR